MEDEGDGNRNRENETCNPSRLRGKDEGKGSLSCLFRLHHLFRCFSHWKPWAESETRAVYDEMSVVSSLHPFEYSSYASFDDKTV